MENLSGQLNYGRDQNLSGNDLYPVARVLAVVLLVVIDPASKWPN